MKTLSYSHKLHNLTAFSQIQKNDSYITSAWKIPTGRLLSIAVTVAALTEAFLSTVATVVLSPLYIIDNDRFNAIANEAVDSTKTAAHAAGRVFGYGTIEKNELPTPKTLAKDDPQATAKDALQPTTKPVTPWEKALQFMKDRVSDVTHVALRHPNTTFVAVTLGVTILVAWKFELFEYAFGSISVSTSSINNPPINENLNPMCYPSEAPTVLPTNLSNISLIKDHNPFMSYPSEAPTVLPTNPSNVPLLKDHNPFIGMCDPSEAPAAATKKVVKDAVNAFVSDSAYQAPETTQTIAKTIPDIESIKVSNLWTKGKSDSIVSAEIGKLISKPPQTNALSTTVTEDISKGDVPVEGVKFLDGLKDKVNTTYEKFSGFFSSFFSSESTPTIPQKPVEALPIPTLDLKNISPRTSYNPFMSYPSEAPAAATKKVVKDAVNAFVSDSAYQAPETTQTIAKTIPDIESIKVSNLWTKGKSDSIVSAEIGKLISKPPQTNALSTTVTEDISKGDVPVEGVKFLDGLKDKVNTTYEKFSGFFSSFFSSESTPTIPQKPVEALPTPTLDLKNISPRTSYNPFMSYPSEVPVETTSLTNVSLPTSITNQVGNITNLVQSKVEEGICAAPNVTTSIQTPILNNSRFPTPAQNTQLARWTSPVEPKKSFLPQINFENFFPKKPLFTPPIIQPSAQSTAVVLKGPLVDHSISRWSNDVPTAETFKTFLPKSENTATFTLPPSDSSKTAPSLTSSYFLRFLKNNDAAEKLGSEIRNSTYIK